METKGWGHSNPASTTDFSIDRLESTAREFVIGITFVAHLSAERISKPVDLLNGDRIYRPIDSDSEVGSTVRSIRLRRSDSPSDRFGFGDPIHHSIDPAPEILFTGVSSVRSAVWQRRS